MTGFWYYVLVSTVIVGGAVAMVALIIGAITLAERVDRRWFSVLLIVLGIVLIIFGLAAAATTGGAE